MANEASMYAVIFTSPIMPKFILKFLVCDRYALPQLLWFQRFLSAQGYPELPAPIWEDNESTITLAKRDDLAVKDLAISKFDIFGSTTT